MNRQFNSVKFYLTGRAVLYNHNVTKKGCENLKQGGGGKVLKGYLSSAKKQEFLSRCIYMLEHKVNMHLKTFTLTYPEGFDTTDTKKHLNRFLTWLKKDTVTQKGCERFAYVAELTEKGTIHYHFIADTNYIDILKINKIWCNARGTEFTRVAVSGVGAITKVKTKYGKVYNPKLAIKYFSKYLTKAEKAVKTSSGQIVRKCSTSHELSRVKINAQMSLTWFEKFENLNKYISGGIIFENEYVKMVTVADNLATFAFKQICKAEFCVDNGFFEHLKGI